MCVERICDRVLIVKRGRLEQAVSHQRIEFRLVQLDPQTSIPSRRRSRWRRILSAAADVRRLWITVCIYIPILQGIEAPLRKERERARGCCLLSLAARQSGPSDAVRARSAASGRLPAGQPDPDPALEVEQQVRLAHEADTSASQRIFGHDPAGQKDLHLRMIALHDVEQVQAALSTRELDVAEHDSNERNAPEDRGGFIDISRDISLMHGRGLPRRAAFRLRYAGRRRGFDRSACGLPSGSIRGKAP